MKRTMQRQGQLQDDGSPAVRQAAPARPRTAQVQLSPGGRVVEFSREVRSELRQVAWPTRAEVWNSSTVVFVTLVLLVLLIFGLNWLFSHGVTFLFKS